MSTSPTTTAPPSYERMIEDLREPTREFRRQAPEVWAGFRQLHDASFADGVVPKRVKELVALAIATATKCDGCVAYHARAAVKAGASREEVVEVLGVALLMAGGPASVWAPRALEAYDEFAAAATAQPRSA